MKLNEYCRKLGWDAPKLAHMAGIAEKTARKAILGGMVSPRVGRAIASALTAAMDRVVLPGDIEGLIPPINGQQ